MYHDGNYARHHHRDNGNDRKYECSRYRNDREDDRNGATTGRHLMNRNVTRYTRDRKDRSQHERKDRGWRRTDCYFDFTKLGGSRCMLSDLPHSSRINTQSSNINDNSRQNSVTQNSCFKNSAAADCGIVSTINTQILIPKKGKEASERHYNTNNYTNNSNNNRNKNENGNSNKNKEIE